MIAPLDQLPEFIAAFAARQVLSPADAAATRTKSRRRDAAARRFRRPRLDPDWGSAFEAGEGQLRNHGFFYGADKGANALSLSQNGVLVGAVESERPSRFSAASSFRRSSPARGNGWSSRVGAPTPSAAVERMIADGKWSDLAGQAVSFDPDTAVAIGASRCRSRYVLPERFVLSDVRSILGGVFTDNIYPQPRRAAAADVAAGPVDPRV